MAVYPLFALLSVYVLLAIVLVECEGKHPADRKKSVKGDERPKSVSVLGLDSVMMQGLYL